MRKRLRAHKRQRCDDKDQRDKRGRTGGHVLIAHPHDHQASRDAQGGVDGEVNSGWLLPKKEIQQPSEHERRQHHPSPSLLHHSPPSNRRKGNRPVLAKSLKAYHHV